MNYRFFWNLFEKTIVILLNKRFYWMTKWIFLYDLQKKIEIGLLEMFNEQIEKKLNVPISTYN